MYDTKFKKEKELQADILLQKEDHTNADKEFHITASTVLNLAKRATEIIKRLEPEEKRQFMGYLLQNCQLNGRNLEFTLRNPFNLITKYSILKLSYIAGPIENIGKLYSKISMVVLLKILYFSHLTTLVDKSLTFHT